MYEELIKKIKAKRPLDRLDDGFVEIFIDQFFLRNPKIKKKFLSNNVKRKDEKLIVKDVRDKLNRLYGQFWLTDKLDLAAHRSSKERLNSYNYVYKKIFSVTGRPKKILDLACGLNPLTYNLIGKDVYFIATELTNYDCNLLKKFFAANDIKGEVLNIDLFNYKQLPKADVCFMFKLLDLLETKGHKLAEKLIKDVDAKYLVVSFSTKTVRDKSMNYPRRGWLDIMLRRLGYKFMIFEINNEVFYIISK